MSRGVGDPGEKSRVQEKWVDQSTQLLASSVVKVCKNNDK